MPVEPIYASRLVRLPLLDSDGVPLGRLDDVVVVPVGSTPPRVLGFLVNIQRRSIFINANRIGTVDPTGVRLHTGTIDVHPFRQRPGEVLVLADLVGRRSGEDFVTDAAMQWDAERGAWAITQVALGRRGPLRRRASRIVAWADAGLTFHASPVVAEVAALRDLHVAEVASRISQLPLVRRRQLAEAMDDERLADLLEELDEDDQIRLIEGLDLQRVAHVLEEMEPDDAADLLGELPEEERQALLDAMAEEDSASMRRLLSYEENTAGGLMTPEPVVLPHTATVAEALALVRQSKIESVLAAQVFVVRPPTSTPTGRYLGLVPFQRLLREPPSTTLEHCTFEDPEPVPPTLPLSEVAALLAAYDALALPVVDVANRLIGAVTVDDVLDRLLPEDWRQTTARHRSRPPDRRGPVRS